MFQEKPITLKQFKNSVFNYYYEAIDALKKLIVIDDELNSFIYSEINSNDTVIIGNIHFVAIDLFDLIYTKNE